MKRIFLLAMALIGIAGCFEPARAATATSVHVEVGKVSEVVIPEKVAKIIKGGEPDSVLVEVLDNSVYLLPKTKSPADVFVSGVSGESYPLNLVIAPEHDVRVQINGSSVRRISQATKTDPMNLMKEILLGHEPAGATVLKNGRTFMLSDGLIRMNVDTVYDFPNIAAYILKARNLSDNNVIIPVEQITFPNLLAVTADQDRLESKGRPGDTAKVYMIASK